MMQAGFWAKSWTRNLTIAAAYCAALVLFRQLSIPHWIILTGFHLSALLLIKDRYWPALIAGDMARLAYLSIACYYQFGLLWAVVNLVPSICFFIPIVWLFRKRWRIFPGPRSVNVGALLLCSFTVACVATAVMIGQILITPFPPDYAFDFGQVLARLVLGNFLGVLTITPIALALHQLVVEGDGGWRRALGQIGKSRLALDVLVFVVPSLAVLIWLGKENMHGQHVAQMGMFLAVVWLAFRHGWKGAAIGGTLASFGILILMPTRNDPATLEAEVLVAMAIATMLLVGERIAALDQRVRQEREDTHVALALAQRNVGLGEVQLMNAALAMEQIRQLLRSDTPFLAPRLRESDPVVDEGSYRNKAQVTEDQLCRLANGLYPAQLHDGLTKALREGQLSRILDEGGMVYWCALRGRVSALPLAIHLAAYRIVCEVVAQACMGRDVSDVHVTLRCGQRQRRWLAIQIDTRANALRLRHIRWASLLPELRRATGGLGDVAISDRAATFEGKVRTRATAHGKRVTVLLLDPVQPGD